MLADFPNSFAVIFSVKFETKSMTYFSPHLKCVTVLPCEIQNSKNSKTLVYVHIIQATQVSVCWSYIKCSKCLYSDMSTPIRRRLRHSSTRHGWRFAWNHWSTLLQFNNVVDVFGRPAAAFLSKFCSKVNCVQIWAAGGQRSGEMSAGIYRSIRVIVKAVTENGRIQNFKFLKVV